MPDSSGIPFLGDMAAMRDATARLGGAATRINPVVPVDFIVDHFGPGVDELTLPDRATIANMTPEYGATMSFFPIDAESVSGGASANSSSRADVERRNHAG